MLCYNSSFDECDEVVLLFLVWLSGIIRFRTNLKKSCLLLSDDGYGASALYPYYPTIGLVNEMANSSVRLDMGDLLLARVLAIEYNYFSIQHYYLLITD